MVTFFRPYRMLISQREAAWLAVSALATRLPTPLLSLGFLITVSERSGSYAEAGFLWTAYAASYAIITPITGQLADRRGPRLVLLGCLAGYVPALVTVVVVLFARAPAAALIPAAGALGAFTPPAGPLVRGSWPAVVPADRLQSAYALDAVITESTLIIGPLLASLLITVTVPIAAVIAGGVSMIGGTAQLLLAPSVKGWQGHGDAARHRGLRGLRTPGLPVLFVIAFFDIVAYGCLIVGITAVTTHHHARGASGVLLSMLSVGVVVGGLVYGTRQWRGSERAQLSILYAAGALILVIAGWLELGLLLLGVLFVASGMLGGPRDTLLQLVLGRRAPPEDRTAVFAWYGTITWASYGLGTALGGQLVGLSHGTGYLALLAAGLGDGCAAVVALRLRRAKTASETGAQAPPAVAAAVQPESDA
jgi:MFS family permease